MEKKLENNELNNETLKEVSGGIIDQGGEQSLGAMVRLAQRDFGISNLIEPEKAAGMFGLYNVALTDAVEDKNWLD